MTALITPGCLVFDIGAHMGESTQRFLAAGAGGVIAVEACMENYLVLASMHRTDHRVVPIHAAALDGPGFAAIHRSVDQTGLSTLDPERWQQLYPSARFARPELVPTVSLDMLIERFGLPHLVKVDVEGLEPRVLAGLSQRVEHVAFEFHGADAGAAVACLDRLETLGYTLGAWMEADLDLAARPLTPLPLLRDLLQRAAPPWGNIVVR